MKSEKKSSRTFMYQEQGLGKIKYTVSETAYPKPAANYITICLLDKEYLFPPQPLNFSKATASVTNEMYGGRE